MTDAKFDVYSHVTEQIIAQIEAGTPPWRKPWTGGAAGAALPMRWNGEAYRDINILMLWAMASTKGYNSERWMTFKPVSYTHLDVYKRQGYRTPSAFSRAFVKWAGMPPRAYRLVAIRSAQSGTDDWREMGRTTLMQPVVS